MYNHHKTDGIFLALAIVGHALKEEETWKASRLADALGWAETWIHFYNSGAYSALQCKHLSKRARAWERWNRLSNLGLAMALVGAVAAEEAAYRGIKILELDTAYQGPAIRICQDVINEAEMAFTAACLKIQERVS